MRTLKKILLSIGIPVISLAGSLKHNSAVITGTVNDLQSKPVPFANVVLKRSADSSFVKAELTDDNGIFKLDEVQQGDYFIMVLVTGYRQTTVNAISVSQSDETIDAGFITITEEDKTLQTVNVVGDRPFIERQTDRTVVNVENSIVLAGTSILDLMEKLPGVQVNKDGGVSLRGKQGVIITIDGKPTGLGGQDLANLLKGMSSSGILKIEIISNPSAKYDAAGNAGIINIVTKKNKRAGSTGSFSAGYGQGKYEKYNGTLMLGYKNSRLNLMFSYNYSHRRVFNNLRLTRNFYNNDTLNTVFDTDNRFIFSFNSQTPKFGADFYLSKKTTVSVLLNGVINSFNPTASNHTNLLNGSGEKTGSYHFTSNSSDLWYNYAANTQLKHDFDTNGTVITVDLDYAKYFNRADQLFTTTLFDAADQYIDKTYMAGDQNGNLFLYSAKSDFTKVFPSGKGKLEAGVKSSYVNADNDVRFYNRIEGTDYFDSLRSNHFIYSENIYAGYLNYSKEFSKLSLQGGLRFEHTLASGNQLLTGQQFRRNYAQLFPSVFADYKFNSKHSINANAGRRIDRPAYAQMNPFRKLIDATTYSEGNPFLLPQLTWKFEVSYTYKNKLFVTAGYSNTEDNIMDVLIQDYASKTTVQSIVNLYRLNYYNLGLTYSAKLTKWWTTNTNLLMYYGRYTGTVNNYSINQGIPAFNFNTSNSFSIADGLSAELGFIYNHKELYGVTMMLPNYNLSMGIQKSLFKKRGSITINVSDLFWKAWPSGITDFGNVNEHWFSRRETRVVNTTFTYRFGKGQAARMRRNTGADEEKRRIGN